MSWDSVSKILSKKGKIPYLKEAEITHLLTKQIQENWEKIFGKLSTQVSFSHIYKGILVVETENPMWASELSFYKKDLLIKTNALLKKSKIYDIRIHTINKKAPQKETKKIDVNTPLEEKIKEENKRKKEDGFLQCKTCLMWWPKNKDCIFCSSSP